MSVTTFAEEHIHIRKVGNPNGTLCGKEGFKYGFSLNPRITCQDCIRIAKERNLTYN